MILADVIIAHAIKRSIAQCTGYSNRSKFLVNLMIFLNVCVCDFA